MRRSIYALITVAVASGFATVAPLRADAAPPAAATAARPAPTAVAMAAATADVPVTLRGSLAAMARQHGVAKELGYHFARTPAQLTRLEAQGELVRLDGNEDYGFRSGVSSLLARAEMRTFLERLSADYREACGERLIVTSLTRPLSRQPRNAHRLSVHPAGIAVDLRVSQSAHCRRWLEDTLLMMEEQGLLDVTREYSPPHYHVALFPVPYMERVAVMEAEAAVRRPPELEPSPGSSVERPVGPSSGRASLHAQVEAGVGGAGTGWRLLAMVPLTLVAGVTLRHGGRTGGWR